MVKGREIFLAQLKEMLEGYKTMEGCLLNDNLPVLRAQAFGVPRGLREAFYAYHAEFLTDHGTCTNITGPFYNDEDMKNGVRNKFWYFYWPIVKLVEMKYPNFKLSVTIEPHYDDSSNILVTAENMYGRDALPFPVVVFQECIKAWNMLFDTTEEPENVFMFLSGIFDRMNMICGKAVSLFSSLK